MVGIGLGVELVTIDSYLSELVPRQMRGRAFALNQVITYLSVPTIALLAWQLVPLAPLGLDGWRWVVLAGSIAAILVWGSARGFPKVRAGSRRTANRGGPTRCSPRSSNVSNAKRGGHCRSRNPAWAK